MTEYLGIDIGGSGIKGAPVDLDRGELTENRHRIPTPQPATPEAVADVVGAIAGAFSWEGSVGCTVPGVVIDGVVHTAANIDPSWIDCDARSLLEQRTGCPVHVVNDADAAGVAEMRYGAGRKTEGVVLMLTFGTGIGSAVFVNGVLIPNTELGHVEFQGGPAEHYAAGRLVEQDAMDLEWWAERVGDYLRYLERILSPNAIIIGGGISKRYEEYAGWSDLRAEVRPAQLRNNAGIVGAALAAALATAGEQGR